MTDASINPIPEISEACFRRFLRLPASRPMEGPLEENATFVRTWYATHARPWIVSAPVALAVEGDNLLVDGEPFSSGQLAARIGDRCESLSLGRRFLLPPGLASAAPPEGPPLVFSGRGAPPLAELGSVTSPNFHIQTSLE